ncbi:hypothetical protein KKH23_07090 [Patescibacteria group bacterium]|nr:hypothetical protein [Patescibacteria group bacterium]
MKLRLDTIKKEIVLSRPPMLLDITTIVDLILPDSEKWDYYIDIDNRITKQYTWYELPSVHKVPSQFPLYPWMESEGTVIPGIYFIKICL